MSAQLDADIAVMVGEMEELACEHRSHRKQPHFHSEEPASHYAQTRCPGCGYASNVTPVCPGYAAAIASSVMTVCRFCSVAVPLNEMTSILGPVNK